MWMVSVVGVDVVCMGYVGWRIFEFLIFRIHGWWLSVTNSSKCMGSVQRLSQLYDAAKSIIMLNVSGCSSQSCSLRILNSSIRSSAACSCCSPCWWIRAGNTIAFGVSASCSPKCTLPDHDHMLLRLCSFDEPPLQSHISCKACQCLQGIGMVFFKR